MPEWLIVETSSLDPSLTTLTMRLLLAWLGGWLVAVMARCNKSTGEPDTLTLTLILMCILIAMATQIIGDNIARAFSLVGALLIVRFRTAVPATRDVAFVLAAVVVGMAIGAGQYWVSALGLVVVGLATRLDSSRRSTGGPQSVDPTAADIVPWRLTMQVSLHGVGSWHSELERLTESYELLTAETARRGGALELVYRVLPKSGFDAARMIATLNGLPAVESVSLKQVGL